MRRPIGIKFCSIFILSYIIDLYLISEFNRTYIKMLIGPRFKQYIRKPAKCEKNYRN